MTESPPAIFDDNEEQIATLIRTLHETQERLQELTGGEVDAVLHPGGHSYLLHEAQERMAWLASFPERNPNAIVELDLGDGVLHYRNPAAHQQFPDLESQGLRHPLVAGLEDILDHIAEEGTLRREIAVGERFVSQMVIPLAGTRRVRIYSTDITEGKSAEAARLTSEARYRVLFEYAPDGIVIADQKSIYLDANASICGMLGYTREEFVGLHASDIVAQTEIPHIESALSVLNARSDYHREWLFRRKDGSVFPAEVIATMMPDGNLLAMIRDVTERARAENVLRRQANLLDVSFDAILVWEFDGNIIFWNQGATELYGYASDVAIGQRSHALFKTRHPEGLAPFEEQLKRDGWWTGELHHTTLDGRRIVVESRHKLVQEINGPLLVLETNRDVTERKRAEEASRESAERFRTMANSMPQLAWIARADGFVFWYNERWYEYTGTTAAQVEGWDWRSVHDPQMLPEVIERWTAAIESGEPFEMEFQLRGADGRFRMFLTRGQPMKNSQGIVVQWFGTNTDIDELNRLEKSLRATQARLNSTLSAGSIGTWTWDIANDLLAADEFTARVFSVAANAAAKGLPASVYLHAVVGEDQPAVSAALARAIESCGTYDIEYRVRQKDGALLWLQARGRVEGDAAGHALNFHGAVMDITARKLAEEAIRESAEHFRFLDSLGEATRTLTDPAQIMAVMARMLGEHLRASRCAYADVEKDAEQFIIRYDYTDGCASVAGTHQLSLLGTRAAATLRSGKTLIIRNVKEELLPNEGADRFDAIGIQAIIARPLLKDGRLRAMLSVHQATSRDWNPGEITIVEDVAERCWTTIERRTAEGKIRQLNADLEQRVDERTAQLESANKELEAFSYSVSHDLRAPLRAMDGYSQAVLEDYGAQLPAEGQSYLHTIRAGAQRMGLLIDDLLTFSRLSRAQLDKQEVNTDALVRSILTDLTSQQTGRQIDLRIGELPACTAAPNLLKQVWINLLSNAFKYTQKREIAMVEIGCEAQPAGDVYFVRDNGAGFDMRYVDKLFGVFQRLHRADEFEGTGVGLAIVQRIIHRHGGQIWAQAAVDRGATFYFTLKKTPHHE